MNNIDSDNIMHSCIAYGLSSLQMYAYYASAIPCRNAGDRGSRRFKRVGLDLFIIVWYKTNKYVRGDCLVEIS